MYKALNYYLIIGMRLIITYILSQTALEAKAQVFSPDIDLDLEMKYRKGKTFHKEAYFKNGRLDSVYRQWDNKGNQVTEGFYLARKKHGTWTEWLTMYASYSYIRFIYNRGVIKEIHEFSAWGISKNSPKHTEYYYKLEPDKKNYTVHVILWNSKLPNQREEEWQATIRKNVIVKSTRKVWWSNGQRWKEEFKTARYHPDGHSSLHKHGRWRLWHKDGTLQRETWYDMGKKLREKRYDHGKLISDTKY